MFCHCRKADCIFCENKYKIPEREITREQLVKCTNLATDEKVRAIATKTMDSKLLVHLSEELVATQGCYHRSCYRNYTRSKESEQPETKESINCGDKQYHDVEAKAYECLFEFIRQVIIPKQKIVKLTDLTSHVVSFMESSGIHEVKHSTRTRVRRKLETEFRYLLQLCSDSKYKVLVYPSTMTIEQVVIENQKL